jgi:predicted dehydrogenase
MAKDMKSYKYRNMWSENTSNVENGVNDVDDYITGYVRTDKASIAFNGAWAQNVGINEMYIDFMGDKGGARLNYGGKFTFWSGETLEEIKPEYDIPNMYLCEDTAFIQSIETGVKDKNNVENILESMKLLDALYRSAEQKGEIKF